MVGLSINGGFKHNLTVTVAIMFLLNIAFITHPAECSSEKFLVCGEKLVKMLNVVCKRCFNGGGIFGGRHETAKRSESTGSELLYHILSNINDDDQQQQQQTPVVNTEEIPSNDDGSMMTITDGVDNVYLHRQTRIVSGIVQECCLKQCPYATLKSYCASDCPWLQKT